MSGYRAGASGMGQIKDRAREGVELERRYWRSGK